MVQTTGDLAGILPSQILGGIVEKVKFGSTIVALSSSEPMKFGNATIVTFDQDPKAQFVEESGAKSSQGIAPDSVTAVPRKAQVTYRTSDEFLWADEDYQLGILAKMGEKASRAIARGLDLGVYHRINPLTGNVIGGWTNYPSHLRTWTSRSPRRSVPSRRASLAMVSRRTCPAAGRRRTAPQSG